MARLIFAVILTYNCLAVDASFFTWVAKTINPVFDKVFPEAYHPTVRNKLPVYPRTQTEAQEELEEPPTFYIDQNKTIRGLIRRYEGDNNILLTHALTENEIKPKRCGIKCMRKKMRQMDQQTSYLLKEQSYEQALKRTDERILTQDGQPNKQKDEYTVELTWDPTGKDKSELTVKEIPEDELMEEYTDEETRELSFPHHQVSTKSRSTRLPRNIDVPNRTETNRSSCDVCRDSREKYLFTPDRVRCHGHRSEKYTISTMDGYLLTIFRVLPLRATNTSREPVLLNHGLLGSSDDWLLIGKNKSLVYKLLDAGYDVWLGNSRGNTYSKGYLGHCTKQNACYWQFSWQEIGEYDARAMIDHIMRVVKKESSEANVALNYIGHSMGATALIVLLSMHPRYNAYIRMAILLAPLAFMDKKMDHLQNIVTFAESHPKELQDALVQGVDLPSWWLDKLQVGDRCAFMRDGMCSNPLFFIAGPVLKPWDACLRADVLRSVPAGGSLNTLRHFAQNTKHDTFQKRYGGEFKLNDITAPIALFCSQKDSFALEASVHKLYLRLGNTITYQVVNSLSHTEFVWGVDADDVVYRKVLGILKNGLALVHSNNDVKKIKHSGLIK